MVATVTLDRIVLLEANERDGRLVRLVREALVSGISGETDWGILTEALDTAGVPAFGSTLTSDATSNAYGLRLIERNPTVVDGEKVRIQLIYENMIDHGQDLNDPREGLILGEVRCSIQQKTGNEDIDGDLVEVSHTYPVDPDDDYSGLTKTQGKNFQYYDAQRSFVIKGYKKTRKPWVMADKMVGHVNDRAIWGGIARTWMCMACSYRPMWNGRSADNNHYYMDFEFQYDADTWDPLVEFIDDRTNQPPPDLVDGTGYFYVQKLPECDFEGVMGNIIQGG